MFQDEIELSGLGAVKLSPAKRAAMLRNRRLLERRRTLAARKAAAKAKAKAKKKPAKKAKAPKAATKTNWLPLVLAGGAAYLMF